MAFFIRTFLYTFFFCIGAFAVYAMFIFLRMGQAEDRSFEPYWNAGLLEVNNIFAQNGLCASRNNKCLDSNSIFGEGASEGFEVTIYGVQNYQVLGRIVAIFSNEFQKSATTSRLSIKAYAISKNKQLQLPLLQQWNLAPILAVEMHKQPH